MEEAPYSPEEYDRMKTVVLRLRAAAGDIWAQEAFDRRQAAEKEAARPVAPVKVVPPPRPRGRVITYQHELTAPGFAWWPAEASPTSWAANHAAQEYWKNERKAGR
jgi:hypothetical protein